MENNHPEAQIKDNLEDLEMELDDDTFNEMINNAYSRRDHDDKCDDKYRLRKLSHTSGRDHGVRVNSKIKFNFQKILRSKKERAKRSLIDVIGNHSSQHSTVHEGKSHMIRNTETAHRTIHGGPNHRDDDQSRDTEWGQQLKL